MKNQEGLVKAYELGDPMGNVIEYGMGENAGDAYRTIDDPVSATQGAIEG